MNSQPSEPMTREEAIDYLKWRAELSTEPRNTEAYVMAIAALRREGEATKALESLYNECVAAGFEGATDYGWPSAMTAARHAMRLRDQLPGA